MKKRLIGPNSAVQIAGVEFVDEIELSESRINLHSCSYISDFRIRSDVSPTYTRNARGFSCQESIGPKSFTIVCANCSMARTLARVSVFGKATRSLAARQTRVASKQSLLMLMRDTTRCEVVPIPLTELLTSCPKAFGDRYIAVIRATSR